MNFLKNKVLTIFILLYGCSNINYKAIQTKSLGAEIISTSDRFLPYCEKVILDNGEIAYGFMILFLDEEKTVGTATGMLTTKKQCAKWEKGVWEILGNAQSISLRGFGNISEPRVIERFSHTFERHGTFFDNGRSIDFFSIRNNHGNCFSVNPERCQ